MVSRSWEGRNSCLSWRQSSKGTHDDLMAQGGHYAELYNTYFRHQSLEYIESFVG